MRLSAIVNFLKMESASGIVLFLAALAALIVCNSPFADAYHAIWHRVATLHLANFVLAKPLVFWVNEGLMALFFLLVGLELKREFLQGSFTKISQVILPGVAAIGGMVVPSLIYCLLNVHSVNTLQGWAIPVATDIAFALGVLSLFGQRVPLGLKLFLMVLAIFDDVGAIIIIAIFHTASLSYLSLGFALLAILILQLLNWRGVRHLLPYLVVGGLLWVCVLQSGVHATVAGFLLALMIPVRQKKGEVKAPLRRLEKKLHPWVAYFVMPLFAFANAGVSFKGMAPSIMLDVVVLGCALGLFLGKPIGVLGAAWLMVKLGWAKLPKQTGWYELYSVAILCGIGFTMSLFLGTLAFQEAAPAYMTQVRLGVLLGSVLSGVMGALVLQLALRRRN